jgi:hypothetical protein
MPRVAALERMGLGIAPRHQRCREQRWELRAGLPSRPPACKPCGSPWPWRLAWGELFTVRPHLASRGRYVWARVWPERACSAETTATWSAAASGPGLP